VERRCEPELMDDAAQAAAYAEADFSAGDRDLVQRIGGLFGADLGCELIDLGCGPGNISFLLAESQPQACVLGVDGAPAMLQLAHQRLQSRPELAARLSFALSCLPDPQLPVGFSAVVSNSLLHHLHDPQVLWSSVKALAAAGAAVYIKDLRRPSSPEAALALRDRHLSQAPAVLQHDYVASLHAAFTLVEVRRQLEQAGLAEALQVAELDDRYLEICGRLG